MFETRVVRANELMRQVRRHTVIILNIGTDRSEQTVQTQISLMEQSDQGLLCLLFCWHLLNTILHCKNCSNCRTIMVIISGVPIFRIFTVIGISS